MSDPMGWIVLHERKDSSVAKILGEVDVSNASEIEAALDQSFADGRDRHVIDLTDTKYFDSTGIRILFALAARIQSRRQELHIVVPAASLTRRVLEIAGVPQIVPIHASLAEVPWE